VTWVRYSAENVGLFAAGLLIGWLAVALAPGWGGPVIVATIVLAFAGRLVFDGTFMWLGLGMAVTTVATVGVHLRDLAQVGT
jgi:hypothetical protein